jgi:hypothetical protein
VKNWASSISPSDAVVALRSFPRRWRALLAQVGDEEDPEGVLHRRPPDGSPSVQELLTRTVTVLGTADAALRRTLGGSTAGAAAGAGDGIDELTATAEAFANRVDAVDADEWSRAGDSGPTALDVVRDAVATASDDLRQAERTIARVKGRPD